jgi:hypothetical protein
MKTFTRQQQETSHASNTSSLLVYCWNAAPGTSLVNRSCPVTHGFGAGELEDIGNMKAVSATKWGRSAYPECPNIANAEVLDRVANRYLALADWGNVLR